MLFFRFIMNELLHTERTYVSDLKCIIQVRKSRILLYLQTNRSTGGGGVKELGMEYGTGWPSAKVKSIIIKGAMAVFYGESQGGQPWGAFHLPVRSELFSLHQWKNLVYMFLKYLAKMDLILMLSKFSGQIGRKPKCFVFHSTIWPFRPVWPC